MTRYDGSDDWMVNGYFQFLCNLVGADTMMRGQYWHLLKVLHSTEFYWTNEYDGNRASYGEDLRVRYFNEINGQDAEYEEFLYSPCSVLEMLTALAIAIEQNIMMDWRPESPDRTPEWFWMMIENLDVMDCSDDNWSASTDAKIRHNLENFMDRNYESNGKGGLFPLRNPTKNQRNVDIWYQMQAYMLENFF